MFKVCLAPRGVTTKSLFNDGQPALLLSCDWSRDSTPINDDELFIM